MSDRFFYAPGGDAVAKVLDRRRQEANAGLVWDRYLPVWRRHPPIRTSDRREDSPKADQHDVLKYFVDAFQSAGNRQDGQLHAHQERRLRALKHLENVSNDRSFRQVEFQLVWRMATGLGADHPTENGFAFDTLTGVPYLTGSAVKGMCRRAAGLEEMPTKKVERLFGPEKVTAAESGFRGELVFFDAFPGRWPTLAVDIINCHHSDYYRSLMNKQNEANIVPPRETEDPIPVFFLTVDQGAHFTFPIGAKSADDLETAYRLLELGFEWLGIGAKTAVGYGVFKKGKSSTSPSDKKSTTTNQPDPLEAFKTWFDRQGYAQGRNKGQLDLLKHQVCKLPSSQRESAIDYALKLMKKAFKNAEFNKISTSLRAPCP